MNCFVIKVVKSINFLDCEMIVSKSILYDQSILATANMQFGQEMALVMQTTHAQRWQYPDRVDKRSFSSIENVHRYITKILEFEYKTDMF